jgi:prevent-host-death family protein
MKRSFGAEQARAQLPRILDEAYRGRSTVVTKHGRPYAAIVPAKEALRRGTGASVLALRGSGRGLWGRNPAGYVARMRKEWK